MDAQREAWAEQLLAGSAGNPYAKWRGLHWRLVELAELGVDIDRERVRPAVASVLDWLSRDPAGGVQGAPSDPERPRLHASIPGNAVYGCSTLGFADDPQVGRLVDALLRTQWPDGGWNCDRHRDAAHSSFHETVTAAIGLARYAEVSGRAEPREAAARAGELLLARRLFRRHQDGPPVHPSWVALHYPPYWHYDVLQGLRLLHLTGQLQDERARDGLEVVASRRRGEGFTSASWASTRQPQAVNYGSGTGNVLLNERAEGLLAAAVSP